jgi:hypothetical protein
VAALMDAWAPAVFTRASGPFLAPTIDLTIHFRAPTPIAGTKGDDFYLSAFRSTVANDGFFEEDGELWSPHGELLAQSRQLALALKPWLGSGQANGGHAHLHRQADDPLDLLEAQHLVALEPGQALGRHAVLAAKVATIGDRDAKVGDPPAVAVLELCVHRSLGTSFLPARGTPHSRRPPAS